MNDYRFDDDLDTELERVTPTIEELIKALQAENGTLPNPTIVYGLSDLSDEALAKLSAVWDGLGTTYLHVLLQMLVDVAESDYSLDYSAIALYHLNHADASIRRAAIELLAEDERFSTMDRLIKMAKYDSDLLVRAEAMRSLGNFILWGELGDLSESETKRAQQCALTILNNPDEPIEVRGKALVAISNCSHHAVSAAIRKAYRGDDPTMRLNAITAMGLTCDRQWEDIILNELDNEDVATRNEAARSAGQLQLAEALPYLAQMLREDDPESHEIAIWSLGEIGGKEAMRLLNSAAARADEEGDDDLLAMIDDALGNANLADGGDWLMMDIEENDWDTAEEDD